MVLPDATTGPPDKCLLLADASRAYMYAPVNEEMYVDICEEAQTHENQGRCWKLMKSMYGTRPAALNWQRELTRVLESKGSYLVARHHAPSITPVVAYHCSSMAMTFYRLVAGGILSG